MARAVFAAGAPVVLQSRAFRYRQAANQPENLVEPKGRSGHRAMHAHAVLV